MQKKKRLLLIEPVLNPPGGAQCVAAWAMQALRDEYTVDLYAWTPVDFEDVNRFYGTTLNPNQHKTWSAPAWLNRIVSLDPDPWSFQRIALLMRLAKWNRHHYDLVISFCDEVEFGAPAIQYIHFPHMGRIYREQQRLEKTPGWLGWIGTAIYLHRPWRLISGFSFERMRANLTLTNSQWTGKHIRKEHGIAPIVLYPPVPGDFPTISWEERENGFVCIGRIAGEKRYEQIISILSAVRARGHAVHLHIVGAVPPGRDNIIYYQRIVELVREHLDWVTLEENISRGELARLITQHRYGIHGMPNEHFGIAVGEMMQSGCIPFVPASGGQMEIVGADERLCYATDAEAVEKIVHVLTEADLQRDVCAQLAQRAEQFTPAKFSAQLQNIVANFFAINQTARQFPSEESVIVRE